MPLPAEKLKMKCMRGHPFEATASMIGLNKTGSSFKLLCPTCGSPAGISAHDASRLLGLKGEDAKNVIKLFGEGKIKVKSEPEPNEAPAVPNDIDCESEEESQSDAEEEPEPEEEEEPTSKLVKKQEDETDSGENMENETEEEFTDTEEPVPQPKIAMKRPVGPVPQIRQSIRPQAKQEEIDNDPVMTEDDVEVPPKDILIDVIKSSGVPQTDIDALVALIKYRTDWDPWSAKNLFDTYGFTEGVAMKLSRKFQARLEAQRLARDHQKRLTNLVTSGMSRGGQSGYPSQFPSSGFGQKPMESSPPGYQQTPDVNDPMNTAIQAIINAAGGRITPQVLASIDSVRAAMAGVQAPSRQQMPVQNGNSDLVAVMQAQNMQTMKLFETMMLSQQQQKTAEEDKKKEDALNQKFEQMQGLIMQVANRSQVAPAPQASVTDVLLTLLKDKMTAPEPKKDTLQETMLMKLFDNVIESGKGANESVAQAISELKSEISGRNGGGIGGLPSNPDQLKGLVDLQRLSAEIKKTENEFANNAQNREMISGIAESAFQTIGQALVSKFTMNTGTPEEKSVNVKEQPIDDGSVVQIVCPACQTQMTAPADARAIRCPNCNNILDRAMTPEGEILKIREKPAPQPQPTPQVEQQPQDMQPQTKKESASANYGGSSKSEAIDEKSWVPLSPKIKTDAKPESDGNGEPMSPQPVPEIRRVLGPDASANSRETDLSGSTDITQDDSDSNNLKTNQ